MRSSGLQLGLTHRFPVVAGGGDEAGDEIVGSLLSVDLASGDGTVVELRGNIVTPEGETVAMSDLYWIQIYLQLLGVQTSYASLHFYDQDDVRINGATTYRTEGIQSRGVLGPATGSAIIGSPYNDLTCIVDIFNFGLAAPKLIQAFTLSSTGKTTTWGSSVLNEFGAFTGVQIRPGTGHLGGKLRASGRRKNKKA